MTAEKRKRKVAASMKYNAKNVKQVKMNLNKTTDADIIDHLAQTGNIQGYIKALIRKDMAGTGETSSRLKLKIIDGEFTEGSFVTVSIDGREFRRKPHYSSKWGDLVVTVFNTEYAKYEFEKEM